MAERSSIDSPSRTRLFLLTLLAFILGAIITVCFILPVEYHIDPTGFGKISGLGRLAGPKEVEVAASGDLGPIARKTATAYRTDTIEIPLASGYDRFESELEYKVRMKKGDALVYSWEVVPAVGEEEFYYDFHSQSDPSPDIQVMSHEATTGNNLAGALVAPFGGIHGWYLQNQSENAVTVRLHIAGFYQLVTEEELNAAAAAARAAEKPQLEE